MPRLALETDDNGVPISVFIASNREGPDDGVLWISDDLPLKEALEALRDYEICHNVPVIQPRTS